VKIAFCGFTFTIHTASFGDLVYAPLALILYSLHTKPFSISHWIPIIVVIRALICGKKKPEHTKYSCNLINLNRRHSRYHLCAYTLVHFVKVMGLWLTICSLAGDRCYCPFCYYVIPTGNLEIFLSL